MRFNDPFTKMSEEVLKLVSSDRRRAIEADNKLDARIEQYREIIEDPRYQTLRAELYSDLASELRRLVDSAKKVPELASIVEKITLYERIISEPFEEIWKAENQLNLTSDEL